MAQDVIRHLSDNKVILGNPTDYTDPNVPTPISQTLGYTFTTFPIVRIYDASKRTASISQTPSSSDDIDVDTANAFDVGDTVEFYVTTTAGGARTRTEGAVLSTDTLADVITLEVGDGPGVGETIEAEEVVQTKLGIDIDLTEMLSTPSIDTDLNAAEIWGYEGTILATHDGLDDGMRVRLECFFETDGSPGLVDHPVRADVPVVEQSG